MFQITHEAAGNISEYDGPLWKVVGNEVTGTVDLEVFANWFTSCCWCWNEFLNLIGNMWIPLRDCEYNTIFQIFFKAKIYIHFNLVSLQNIISRLTSDPIRFTRHPTSKSHFSSCQYYFCCCFHSPTDDLLPRGDLWIIITVIYCTDGWLCIRLSNNSVFVWIC